MARSTNDILKRTDFVSKRSKAFTGKGTPIIQTLAGGREVIVGEIPKVGKVRKRVTVDQRNNSFSPPKDDIEIVNEGQDDNVKIQRGTSGPKLAESIIELFSYLSLSQRNEVLELVLTHVVMSAIEETNRKREVYHESEKSTEQLHGLITGGLMNKAEGKKIVPSYQ
jgi:hypothetical protein